MLQRKVEFRNQIRKNRNLMETVMNMTAAKEIRKDERNIVDTVADADGIDITAQHGIEPDAAIAPHYDITDDSGIVSQITVFSNLRCESSYRFYKCHNSFLAF